MSLIPDVQYGIMMATWSIVEASYFVHNLAPGHGQPPLLSTSTSPPSKTYYWLIKEEMKGSLTALETNEGVTRFSPGTLMRHLENNGQPFQKKVLSAYMNHGPKTGPSKSSTAAWFIYRKVAELIRSEHPGISASNIAEVLVKLPSHYNALPLPVFSEKTIRKHLYEMGGFKRGRPKKSDKPEIDLASIIKKLLY